MIENIPDFFGELRLGKLRWHGLSSKINQHQYKIMSTTIRASVTIFPITREYSLRVTDLPVDSKIDIKRLRNVFKGLSADKAKALVKKSEYAKHFSIVEIVRENPQ
jgi:hypothetical protein